MTRFMDIILDPFQKLDQWVTVKFYKYLKIEMNSISEISTKLVFVISRKIPWKWNVFEDYCQSVLNLDFDTPNGAWCKIWWYIRDQWLMEPHFDSSFDFTSSFYFVNLSLSSDSLRGERRTDFQIVSRGCFSKLSIICVKIMFKIDMKRLYFSVLLLKFKALDGSGYKIRCVIWD